MEKIIYDDFYDKTSQDWQAFLEKDRQIVPTFYKTLGKRAEDARIIEASHKKLEELIEKYTMNHDPVDEQYPLIAFVFDKRKKKLTAVKQLDKNLNSFLKFKTECHSIRTIYSDGVDIWVRDIHNNFRNVNHILFRRAACEYDFDQLNQNYICSSNWTKYRAKKIRKNIELLSDSILPEINRKDKK